MKLHTGTSGYNYSYWGPSNNKSINNFYKIKTKTKWLTHYSENLKSVEINFTRYRKLTPTMCSKWLTQIPEDFSITIKAATYITHSKKLCDFEDWWNEFYPCITVLGNSFCSVLFQFPPTFTKSKHNLDKLQNVKSIIPQDVKCAFEFRDTGWYQPDSVMEELFKDNWTQVILVVPEVRNDKFNFGNLPGGIHIGVINNNFVYLRFHGTKSYSSGTYGIQNLTQIKELINNINPKIVCTYFNNVDSWTLLPYRNIEMDYIAGVLSNVQLTPSAVYDAKLLSEIFKT